MARIHGVAGHRYTPLEVWEMSSTEPGALNHPRELDRITAKWLPARAPGTVAGALRAAGQWELGDDRSLDASDWWYRCRFDAAGGGATFLELEGLATIADVWLNGTHVLRSDNMFHGHSIDVTSALRRSNELAVRFSSLSVLLSGRRPRPRWRTQLVQNQALRWFRTTLLGRMPGFCPSVEAVGPWRPVGLATREALSVERASVKARVDGSSGEVHISLRVRLRGGRRLDAAFAQVDGERAALAVDDSETGLASVSGAVRVPGVALWWPHTHGPQPLYPASIVLRSGGEDFEVDCGRLGFRTIDVDGSDGGFSLSVNAVPIFCRGACWTSLDVVDLVAPPSAYADALDLVRDAGMNMIRVSGTMHYESDAFYEACDERGILVWQDFMFASLDYPGSDDAFRSSAIEEATQFVSRVQTSPCVAVLCGNSEVSQQAAMLGLPPEFWSGSLFEDDLARVAREERPDVPYLPSTPCGGPMPFSVRAGVSHYYGVGAYRRPLDDARRAGVRFTAECLAFSHVPEDSTIDLVLPGGEAPCHHPSWKARIPRDPGAGWDFEDVRDHYLASLFGVDPVSTRSRDMASYLALSRVATGEVLASTLSEWRSLGSSCKGALVWFLRDLWPGAGWGLVDSTGLPKAAFYFMRRVLSPVALVITDEGLDGLALHAVNETPVPMDVEIDLALYRRGGALAASGQKPFVLGARSTVTTGSDALLGQFLDVTYAYRFGPPERDVVVGTLRSRGSVVGRSFYFPLGHGFAREHDLGLEAAVHSAADGGAVVHVKTKRFAQAVAIRVPGYVARDNYFHLEPDGEREISLRPLGALRTGTPQKVRGTVHALNAVSPVPIAGDIHKRG